MDGESGESGVENKNNGENAAPGITLFGDDDTVIQDLAPARAGPGEPLSGSDDSEFAEEGEEGEEAEELNEQDVENEENAWMDGESSADSAGASVQSESTDANLDEVDREALERAAGEHAGAEGTEFEDLENFEENGEDGEEESELSEQRADNEDARIAHHMRRMRLEKPQASRQYYHDLIYGYYKRPDARAAAARAGAKKASSGARKPGLLQLFDDEPENKDLINVDLFPADFATAVAPLPFELRDSTRVYPIETQLVGGELTLPGEFGADEYAKYFLGDTDFVEAVHKCLDGEGIQELGANAPEPEKEAAPKEEGPANPLMDIKIDGSYLEEKQREAARTMARERLLDRQFDQETFLPGEYVRFCFTPAKEFLEHYNEAEPLIIGGLLPGESTREYLTAKVKRHRWFPKILKSRNPLVLAVGWRRFQTLPIYALEQENKTAMGIDTGLITETPPMKMLKYTPEHMHCQCIFYGYRVPAGSGLVAF